MAQTLLNISSKERIQTLKLSGMEAFTVMATVCTLLSLPLLAVSYAKDEGHGVVTALNASSSPCLPGKAVQVIAMAALAYHVEYTLNFLFIALCHPLAFSVTDIVRRLGTICCGAVLFNKPMSFWNALGVVISLTGVVAYTLVSRRIAQAERAKEWTDHYGALKSENLEDLDTPTHEEMLRTSSDFSALEMATGDSSMGIAPEALCQIAVWTSPPRRKRFGRFMSDTGLQEHVVSPKQTALGIFRRCQSDSAPEFIARSFGT